MSKIRKQLLILSTSCALLGANYVYADDEEDYGIDWEGDDDLEEIIAPDNYDAPSDLSDDAIEELDYSSRRVENAIEEALYFDLDTSYDDDIEDYIDDDNEPDEDSDIIAYGGSRNDMGGGIRYNDKLSTMGASVDSKNDDMGRGIWVRGSFGSGKQKIQKSTQKSTALGIATGANFRLGKKIKIGLTFSNINRNTKGSTFKAKDNIKNIGIQLGFNATKNLSFKIVPFFGNNTTNNNSKRKANKAAANGSFTRKSKLFGFDLSTKYQHKLTRGITLAPTLGIKYVNINTAAYTENISGGITRNISGAKSDKIIGTVGLKLSKYYDTNWGGVVPELHANVHQQIGNRDSKIKIGFSNIPGKSIQGTQKSNPTSWNIGGGMAINYKILELKAEYNAFITQNSLNHQGHLGVKLKF